MKYLCLVYFDEKVLDALPARDLDRLVAESLDYDEVLRRNGHLVANGALEPVRTATTLHVRSGKMSTTDGPFAETKEQLGGFIMIEAADLNEAIQVAGKIPPARLGCIEVRPVKELVYPESIPRRS